MIADKRITKTKKFNGKVYELLGPIRTTKASADYTVESWRSRGRDRGARAVKVTGGYAIYVRGG